MQMPADLLQFTGMQGDSYRVCCTYRYILDTDVSTLTNTGLTPAATFEQSGQFPLFCRSIHATAAVIIE